MKRIFVLILVALFAVSLLITGCSSKKDDVDEITNPSQLDEEQDVL